MNEKQLKLLESIITKANAVIKNLSSSDSNIQLLEGIKYSSEQIKKINNQNYSVGCWSDSQ
tara:strand:+ start:1777 stop:1959 length:183 start_codon:yes stop_codon:yes gene_type:complete